MERSSTPSSGLYVTSFDAPSCEDVTSNRQLFFAKIAKTAGEDEVKALFSKYGLVEDVIIFQSSQGSKTSKGCGLVTMSTHQEASAALTALHGKFSWSNRDPAMVVTWMDMALQDPNRSNNLTVGRIGTRPAGCDPDAVKLFIGNIPLTFTEEQLLPLFQPIGPVVELVVVRNKLSSLSKGCAFVWYAKKEHAEQAIAVLNLKHILPDVTGQQTRPLVVRKARTGHMMGSILNSALASAAAGGLMDVRPNAKGLSQSWSLLGGTPLPDAPTGAMAGLCGRNEYLESLGLGLSSVGGHEYNIPGLLNYSAHGEELPPQVGGHSAEVEVLHHQGQPLALHTLPNGTTFVEANPPTQYHQVVNNSSRPSQYVVMDVAGGQNLHKSSARGMALTTDAVDTRYAPMRTLQSISADLPSSSTLLQNAVINLNMSQLSKVNMHLFNVQLSTKCSIVLSPGGPDMFNLLLSGTSRQVENAQLMIASIIQDEGVGP